MPREADLDDLIVRVLRERGFGAARLNAQFSSLSESYGSPSDICEHDPSVAAIWNYNEFQIWSSLHGVIDRIFFDTSPMVAFGDCPPDLIPFRDHLPTCDAPRFLACCARDGYAVTKNDESTHRIACNLKRENTEIYAIFMSRIVERGSITKTEDARIETPMIYDGPPRLSMLRLNTLN